ncbi:unnamed protein product, partial [Closterium sp. Yama58-4]
GMTRWWQCGGSQADVADPLQLISDRQHQSTLRWREAHLLTRGKCAHPCTLPNRPMLNAL